MTKDWYKAHGYKLSQFIDDTMIERAEADVSAAYIEPIVGGVEVPSEIKERTIGGLAFLLILQRSIFATRAGAKVKTTQESQEADAWQVLQQEAAACHLYLQSLRNCEGVDKEAEVVDICKIYFKTNFFNI